MSRQSRGSTQIAVRLTVLLLVGLLTLADEFGLDVVLGAAIAGVIAGRYAPREDEPEVLRKVEGLAFGLFIPVFFVVSGASLDIISITENPSRLLGCFVLLLVCRGLPQFVLYRRAIPDVRRRWAFTFFVATGFPIIVAVTALEVSAGVMLSENAATLVGAGALSVLVFPLVGDFLAKDKTVDGVPA